MGLFSAPFRGLLRLCEELAERAEQEIYDEDAITAELADLYRKLERGDISVEEHERREAELVELLAEIAERREHRMQGMHGMPGSHDDEAP